MREHVKNFIDALARGRRFVTHDAWHIGRPGEEVPHGMIIKNVRVAILLFQSLMSDRLWLRTAALAFTTILSIVPFLAFSFFIIQTFDLGENLSGLLEERVKQYAENLGIENGTAPASSDKGQGVKRETSPDPETAKAGESETVVTPPAPGTPAVPSAGGDADGAGSSGSGKPDTDQKNIELLRRSLSWLLQGVPEKESEDYKNPLDLILELIEKSSEPTAIGTMLWLLFTVWTVFGLMNVVESTFNAIWGLKASRSWYRRISDYMMIVLVLPFIVAVVFGVTAALETGQVAFGPFAIGLSGARYLLMWLVFATIYFVIPNTKVRPRYALLGGFVAGTAWLLTAKAYVGLQVGLASKDFFYGSFALIPLVLMWIYVSWLILLLGAELTFACQNEKTFAMERLAEGASYAYREAVGLRTMAEIAHRFHAGLPALSPSDRAAEWNVPIRLLNDALDHLEDSCLIQRCATEPVTYQPARSLDRITVSEVVEALRDAGHDPSDFRKDEDFRALLHEVEGFDTPIMQSSLADAIERLHPPKEASLEEPAPFGLLTDLHGPAEEKSQEEEGA